MRAISLTLSAALLAAVGLVGCDQIDTGKGPVVDTAKPTNDASPSTPAVPGDRTPPVSPPVTPPITSPNTPTPESTPSRSSTTTTPGTTADTTPPPGTRPDNTAINQRDAADLTKAKTPIDQDEDQAAIDITAKIRKRVVAEDGFSTYAQNVKIMTQDGMVTLRGPVNSKAEADKIGQIAKEVAGEGKVDNQLEVTPQER
jgi:hyperosmotically inducible periplasmic protein